MGKLVIFNWKTNPDSIREAIQLAKETMRAVRGSGASVVIAPPFIFLERLATTLRGSRVRLGAQDVFWGEGGAHTGEVSWHQLQNLRVTHVILGHSERRALGETDSIINKKVKAALGAGLRVVLCVGEQKQQGEKSARNFVQTQLRKNLRGVRELEQAAGRLIVAYEPVWAISTTKGAKQCSPQYAAEMIRYIERLLVSSYPGRATIVYGGSINGRDIKEFAVQRDIDGFLVGGASLRKNDIRAIIKIVGNRKSIRKL